MSVVFLDAGPLGMATNPKHSAENDACRVWLLQLVAAGVRVVVPEIADYEVRRELLRAAKAAGIARLDRLKDNLEYLPITTAAMLKAADLWAAARRVGTQTAGDHALDGDVVLAAQALTCGVHATDALVATTNVGHMIRFLGAKRWQEIE